jgi:hypothetical protein
VEFTISDPLPPNMMSCCDAASKAIVGSDKGGGEERV